MGAPETRRDSAQLQPGHADGAKRGGQGHHQQAKQGHAPAAEARLAQGELARQAEALLDQLTQVATKAASQWRETAPSQAQLVWLNNKAHRAVQVAQKAFPAVAAGLPVKRVPQEQQHAVTLFQQAMEAVRQAQEAHAEWPGKVELELTQITTTALQQGAAGRDHAQVADLKKRMRKVRELIERVFLVAGSGLCMAPDLASTLARAQQAVEDAVRGPMDRKVCGSMLRSKHTRARTYRHTMEAHSPGCIRAATPLLWHTK